MRLLVTGSSGYLGKIFVDRCHQEGHEVVAIGRSKIQRDNVQSFLADITDRESLQRVRPQVRTIDAIVHLAALVYRKPDEDVAPAMAETNILGTINLLDVFGADAKTIVYGSTAEVYGLPGVNEPISEDLRPEPLSYYGASKLAGEYFTNTFASRNGKVAVNLRFSVMYGLPDPIARAIPNFIRRALANEPLEIYGGEEKRDYLHVEDAAQGVLCALTATKSGTYNIGSGHETSVKDAAKSIVAATKSRSELTIQERQKPAADLVFDISQARTDLGYEPKYTFPEGIEAQIKGQD